MLQLVTGVAEPLLLSGSVISVGSAGIWCVKTLIQVRDDVRAIRQDMFGNPDDKRPGGLMAKVDNHEDRIETLELRMSLRAVEQQR